MASSAPRYSRISSYHQTSPLPLERVVVDRKVFIFQALTWDRKSNKKTDVNPDEAKHLIGSCQNVI